jgi:hypothetical protein
MVHGPSTVGCQVSISKDRSTGDIRIQQIDRACRNPKCWTCVFRERLPISLPQSPSRLGGTHAQGQEEH